MLKVGAARRCISPFGDMLPILMPWNGKYYEEVREGEDLHVRAVVVDNGKEKFVFEGFELGNAPHAEELRGRIEKEFGIPGTNVLMNGTHNHSAPHVANENNRSATTGGDNNAPAPGLLKWTDYVLDQAVEVIRDALSNMKDAKWGFGEGESWININRDELFPDGYWMQGENPKGCSDKTLAVLKFTDLEGNLIAAILNYACHSNLSFGAEDVDGKLKITCDWVGIACSYIEGQYDGSVVMWQSGAAGNQNPIGMSNLRYDKNRTMYRGERLNGQGYLYALSVGEKHAIDALKILDNINCTKDHVGIRTAATEIEFPEQKFPEGIDRKAHRLMVDNLGVVPNVPYEKHLAETTLSGAMAPARAQALLFGDVAFYGVGCEMYNEIGCLCKEESPFKHTVIVTLIGTPHVGYLLDNASTGKKVFQSYGLVKEGHNNEIVLEGMQTLFDEILAK